MELALRMIIKIHHECRNGYEGSTGSITGPILVFVPGKAEIRLLTELIKNAIKRGYTSGLYPYGFHADTPDRDRTFLTNGEEDLTHRDMVNCKTTIKGERLMKSDCALSQDCFQETCWKDRKDRPWNQYQTNHSAGMG